MEGFCLQKMFETRGGGSNNGKIWMGTAWRWHVRRVSSGGHGADTVCPHFFLSLLYLYLLEFHWFVYIAVDTYTT
jgi:hypothetical protein